MIQSWTERRTTEQLARDTVLTQGHTDRPTMEGVRRKEEVVEGHSEKAAVCKPRKELPPKTELPGI